MPRLYVLLVGIDAYRAPVTPLHGCRNDVELAARLLRRRVEQGDLFLETLCDEQATRAGIVGAFREHLGRAGAGDIALFWFSGHGSTGRLPAEIWYAESAGTCQTTVCFDSRHGGVNDLYDKELAVLVREVVASGAQLVTIMDSCHSRSAMRELLDTPPTGLPPRLAESAGTRPALEMLLPELVRDAGDPDRPMPGMQMPGHIALAACQEHEVANEIDVEGDIHGVFSHALSRTLARLESQASYRQVLGGARCLVEGRFRHQVPALEVGSPELFDQDFLGSALRPRAAQVSMRHIDGTWEVDVGALHGITSGETRFARHRSEPVEEVRVAEVCAESSTVEPLDWKPDPEQQYDMVLTRVPLPPVAVVIEGSAEVTDRLAAAVRAASPGRVPSPHIRIIPAADVTAAGLLLRVDATDGRTIRATSSDHEPLAPPVDDDDRGIAQTVADLEHVARWLQIRNLANPGSRLRDAVRLEVVRAEPDERVPPRDRTPEPPGNVAFDYARIGNTWTPPSIFIRLHNTSGRRLFCALADLTDRYRLHVNLFPGEYIAANWTALAGGGPVTLSLPPERPVEPGASGKDWLMLLVAEEPFSSDPFALPRLRDTARGVGRGPSRGITGVLDRLGFVATRRDVDPTPDIALDWATHVVEITTSVPSP